MQYLKVTNLTKSYSSKPLIDHVDFTISKNQKIALIAKNGAGKSTLLKLLMGEVDLTDGEIEWRKDINIGYLRQSSNYDQEKSVKEILFDFDTVQEREHEIELQIIINKLKIYDYIDQKLSTLSGGELKRVMLAKVLAAHPPMLVLDEPTNHLDLDMIERLERYLKKNNSALLMVTHDRYFLQRVCTDIFELDRGKIHSYPGNYSYFLEKKAEREENEKIETHKLKQLFHKELDRIRKSPQGRQTKSNSRQKTFYNIQDKYESRKEIVLQESAKLKLYSNTRPLGTKIIKLKSVSKSFGEKIILQDFAHEFKHAERIGIIGKNGVGKSTFINMLMGLESFDSGVVDTGETVVFGYYAQTEMSLPDDKKLIDIVPNPRLLEQFLFPLSQQHQLAKTLSGGEKRRLYLLTILQKNPNFLILDEPTNDLDLVTLGVLEDFLLNFKGCLLVISHDRFFMDKVVDHLFVFEGQGKINDFRGTYTEYKIAEEEKQQIEKEEKVRLSEFQSKQKLENLLDNEDSPRKKLSYNEKKEIDQLSKDIEMLDKRKDAINLAFNDINLPFDEIKNLSTELGTILKQLEIKENRRLELIERE